MPSGRLKMLTITHKRQGDLYASCLERQSALYKWDLFTVDVQIVLKQSRV